MFQSRSGWHSVPTNWPIKAVFSGAMTDDELVKLRRQAGAQQYGDMSNEAPRLKIMNDQAGVPRPDTAAGRAALNRMEEVTFIQASGRSVWSRHPTA